MRWADARAGGPGPVLGQAGVGHSRITPFSVFGSALGRGSWLTKPLCGLWDAGGGGGRAHGSAETMSVVNI